jgi:hypothetical protein
MNQYPENRQYPRMVVDCGIAWRPVDDDATRTGVARNISGNGVLFVAAERAAVGEMMEITVNPGTLSIPALNALVEVVRVEEDPLAAPPGADSVAPAYQIGARIMVMR